MKKMACIVSNKADSIREDRKAGRVAGPPSPPLIKEMTKAALMANKNPTIPLSNLDLPAHVIKPSQTAGH